MVLPEECIHIRFNKFHLKCENAIFVLKNKTTQCMYIVPTEQANVTRRDVASDRTDELVY